MALQITQKWSSGSTVTTKVLNSGTTEQNAVVHLVVRLVGGQDETLISDPTPVPAGTTRAVHLQASGTVEYILDSPEPFVQAE